MDSDYHVILDIRNEAAVAFLALKELDAYSYNNAAYTDLYKVQGKTKIWKDIAGSWNDRTRIRRLVSSSVSSCDCFSDQAIISLYMRKMLQNRLNLEQVLLDIIRKFLPPLWSDLRLRRTRSAPEGGKYT